MPGHDITIENQAKNMKLHTLRTLGSAIAFVLLLGCGRASQEFRETLRPAGFVSRPELATVVSVHVSPDNRFLYSAAYNTASVIVFARDMKTGQLNHVQTLSDPEVFQGVTSVRISPDGKWAATAAFRSQALALLKRDAGSGTLSAVDAVHQDSNGISGLGFAIAVDFSPDSSFIYAIADGSAALSVFKISGMEKLELVQTEFGSDQCFLGARGIALSPDGRSIYVAGSRGGTLVGLARDGASGKAIVKQVIRSGVGSVRGVGGAFGVACSRDGRNVYLSAGRFGGENAITVFERRDDGQLEFLQVLEAGTDSLKYFQGGNEVTVTPDGLAVYALGTLSDSIACFKRDPKKGTLTQTQSVLSGVEGAGPLGTVSGITVSRDGKFVYAAAETDAAISIFGR